MSRTQAPNLSVPVGQGYERIAPDGFVGVVTFCGNDDFICEAARVGAKGNQSTEALIRYLMRHRHTSPFEFVTFVFHVRLPIFVARQWMRHRTGQFNEWSARYKELPDVYWLPKIWRKQAAKNRQSSGGEIGYVSTDCEKVALMEYRARLQVGVCREQARSCLPVSIYTEFYWKIDLHNLLHFLDLRTDSHAQEEIREYALAIEQLLDNYVPVTMRAWRDFRKDVVTLTKAEQTLLRQGYAEFPSESERMGAVEKLREMGLVTTIEEVVDGVKTLRLVKP